MRVRHARTRQWVEVTRRPWILRGIPAPAHLEGKSIRALLADPQANWDQPAITTYQQNNHTIRNEAWRYTHYADGGEELYQETNDPYEWNNWAKKTELNARKGELGRWLPQTNNPPAKGDGRRQKK